MIDGWSSRLSLAVSACLLGGFAYALYAVLVVEWRAVSESDKQHLPEGARKVTKKVAAGGREVELTLVFFDDRLTRTCVVAQKEAGIQKAQSLAELATAENAIAGCNGGYFKPGLNLPDGLEIAQGVRTGELREDLPWGGVFCVWQDVPALLPDAEFADDAAITDLVQCCPLLVQEGKALRGIGGKDLVARTFIATNGAHGWVMGFSPLASLEDLAEALLAPGVLPKFRVKTAMNLDGGPSSGLWWKPARGEAQGVRATTQVRNVILVLPR